MILAHSRRAQWDVSVIVSDDYEYGGLADWLTGWLDVLEVFITYIPLKASSIINFHFRMNKLLKFHNYLHVQC